MDMVTHQDIGMEAKRVGLFVSDKQIKVFGVVVRILEYLLPLIAAGYDVIECSFKFYSRFPSHTATLSIHMPNVNTQV